MEHFSPIHQLVESGSIRGGAFVFITYQHHRHCTKFIHLIIMNHESFAPTNELNLHKAKLLSAFLMETQDQNTPTNRLQLSVDCIKLYSNQNVVARVCIQFLLFIPFGLFAPPPPPHL